MIDHNEEHLRWRQISDIYTKISTVLKSKPYEKFENENGYDKLAKYGQCALGVITKPYYIFINSLYLSRLNDD